MILILSDPSDSHVAPVAAELIKRGVPFLCYDPASFPSRSSVTIESTTQGVHGFLCSPEFTLDLNDVRGIWYRRPGDFVFLDGLTLEEDKWLREECSHFFRGLWGTCLRARWISNPDAIRAASIKAKQLAIATAMGFSVPRFIITNDIDRASQFFASCAAGAIVKVLAAPSLLYTQRAGTLYTHFVTEKDMEWLSAIRFGPTFLQEYVDKALDIRVTVIGKKIFAFGIHSRYSDEARIDFRRAKIYTLPHSIIELPIGLSTLCIDLVRCLGLSFGAIDLLLTPDGRYVFLEINPNGQWYWLEEITGAPLTSALCDSLAGDSDEPSQHPTS